jgi:hypothetical protein
VAFKQEVNVPLVVTIGVISGLMVLVSVIGMQAWYQSEEKNETVIKAAEAYTRPNNWLVTLQRGQRLAINGKPAWADKKAGTVTMPIEQAMDYLAAHDGKLPSANGQE